MSQQKINAHGPLRWWGNVAEAAGSLLWGRGRRRVGILCSTYRLAFGVQAVETSQGTVRSFQEQVA